MILQFGYDLYFAIRERSIVATRCFYVSSLCPRHGQSVRLRCIHM